MTIPTDGRIDLDALAQALGTCPCCGSDAMWNPKETTVNGKPVTYDLNLGFVDCVMCGLRTSGLMSREVATKTWNRRAAIPSEQGEAVWRTDWQNAPRDGTPVRLRYKGRNDETTLAWSTNYSVYGLGGCWSDGLCTMGDLDFAGWLPAHPAPAAGVKVRALTWSQGSVFGTIKRRGFSPFGEWIAFDVEGLSDDEIRAKEATAQADYEARILSALDQGEPK